MASLPILGPFTSCCHTCNTSDPNFVIGSCQVIFLVLIFDHSVTTYSALDGTHVTCSVFNFKFFNTHYTYLFPIVHSSSSIFFCSVFIINLSLSVFHYNFFIIHFVQNLLSNFFLFYFWIFYLIFDYPLLFFFPSYNFFHSWHTILYYPLFYYKYSSGHIAISIIDYKFPIIHYPFPLIIFH